MPPTARTTLSAQATSRKQEEADLANEALWDELTSSLAGLLKIGSRGRFVDLQNLSSCDALIVLELGDVVGSSLTDTAAHLRRTFAAAVLLSTWAARLRHYNDLSLKFWTRVLQTMHGWVGRYHLNVVNGAVQSVWIRQWVRFVKANGLHLMLRCSRVGLPLKTIQELLAEFLCEPAPRGCCDVPVSISLAFESCNFSTRDLAWLQSLLTQFNFDEQGRATARTIVLRGVQLHGNSFRVGQLTELARLLKDKATASVDELRLGETNPRAFFQVSVVAYASAIRRVMKAIFTSKHPHDGTGVSLWLAGYFEVLELNALCEALQNATRPLRLLSLAHCAVATPAAAKLLGRLLFSAVDAVKGGCDVDISAFCISSTLTTGSKRDEILSALPVLIAEATKISCRKRVPIECQCVVTTVFNDKNLAHALPVTLSVDQYYAVQEIQSNGNIAIRVPVGDKQHETVVCWIRPKHVLRIRTQSGKPLVGWGFSGLIADNTSLVTTFLPSWGMFIGERIVRLSLRRNCFRDDDNSVCRLLESCENLQQLNISHTRVLGSAKREFWDRLLAALPSSLQALDISYCGAIVTHCILSLSRLTQLRYLSLRGNRSEVGTQAMPSNMLRLVEETPSLRYVDMDHEHGSMEDVEGHELVRSDNVNVAFMSVLSTLEMQHPCWKHISQDIILSILEYANDVKCPVVNWCTSWRE